MGVDVNFGFYNFLVFVCENGNLVIVWELLKVGVDVNNDKNEYILLVYVCYCGYFDIVEELIKVGVDINLNCDYCIVFEVVCDYGYLVVLKLLMKIMVYDLSEEGENIGLGCILYFRWYLDVIIKLIEIEDNFDIKEDDELLFVVVCEWG